MDFVATHSAREMYSRAGWTLAFAAVLYFINRAEYPGPALTLLVVLTLLAAALAGVGYGLHWIATEGQRRVREQILNSLELNGSERILSLDHELGIDAAKRLKSGKVISLGDTASNEAARDAAKTAGLADKIRFESSDASGKLSYPDANFDVVLAVPDASVQDLVRVLKPGGRIAYQSSPAISASFSNAVEIPSRLPLGLGGRTFVSRK